MRIQPQQIWKTIQKNTSVRLVGKVSVVVMFALLCVGVTLGVNVGGAHAKSLCASGDQAYSVSSGNTMSGIANRYGTSWQSLASYNHIANPNVIFVNQAICIPHKGSVGAGGAETNVPATSSSSVSSAPVSNYSASSSAVGSGNPFPYPACTWWADERYHQLHGVYVPWRTNADAWEWTARAYQFGWHVSSSPSAGSIIDLQPWVQGAYGGGHVAVVEQVLSNGHVIASNMSWGANPYQVRYVEFAPGPGVTFIRQ